MPREDYQVPTASAGGSSSAANARGSTGHNHHAAANTVNYQCGDCGISFPMSPSSLVACSSCGGRVLYKQRTKRMVQFEAR